MKTSPSKSCPQCGCKVTTVVPSKVMGIASNHHECSSCGEKFQTPAQFKDFQYESALFYLKLACDLLRNPSPELAKTFLAWNTSTLEYIDPRFPEAWGVLVERNKLENGEGKP